MSAARQRETGKAIGTEGQGGSGAVKMEGENLQEAGRKWTPGTHVTCVAGAGKYKGIKEVRQRYLQREPESNGFGSQHTHTSYQSYPLKTR